MRNTLCKTKRKLNKKGFTLVELLVCVAIMAVIALTLAQFVGMSSNAYRRASAQTKIQEVSQETLTKISNIVRNSKSLVVTKLSNGGVRMESVNYENKNILLIYVPSNDEKTNFGKIYVDYNYEIPHVDPGEDPIYKDITATAAGERYNEYLMTDMVTDFTVDFASYQAKDTNNSVITVVQQRTLDMSLTLERNDKVYTQTTKSSLRNSCPDGQTSELVIQIKNG
jgi:prepilin-type N-terminal cleavage/methylation domain-containing protein